MGKGNGHGNNWWHVDKSLGGSVVFYWLRHLEGLLLEVCYSFLYNAETKFKVQRGPCTLLERMWGMMADYGHIFWTCPLIQPLWLEVTKVILKTLGFSITFSFSELFPGCFTEDLTAVNAFLLKILLASATKAITKCWLQKQPLTLTLFTSIMEQLSWWNAWPTPCDFKRSLVKDAGKDGCCFITVTEFVTVFVDGQNSIVLWFGDLICIVLWPSRDYMFVCSVQICSK